MQLFQQLGRKHYPERDIQATLVKILHPLIIFGIPGNTWDAYRGECVTTGWCVKPLSDVATSGT